MQDLKYFEDIFEENKDRFFENWKRLISFKSISAYPESSGDCSECASWLKLKLEEMGFSVSLVETHKPVVLAHRSGPENSPHIVFYGHYDVQPVDPLEQWETPPFEAQIKNGRMHGRGSQDNKGQMWAVLEAVGTLVKIGKLNCSLTLIIEGEEECGSEGLSAVLPQISDRIRGDYLVVCDSGARRAGVPCITMGLRGLVSIEIKAHGLKTDVHSGMLGGVVKNPAVELARLIATFHDSRGRIAVEGYYDEVKEISREERVLLDKLPLDPESFERDFGVPPAGGEKGYVANERKGVRPTLEVNGFHSGYGGPGSKTIVPSQAIAKITSRLVGYQDPERCLALLEKHVHDHAPQGLKLDITDKAVHGPAVLVSLDSPAMALAKKACAPLARGQIDYCWEGGSIPVVAELVKHTQAQPILVGFGLDEDRIHAPNESFSLGQFKLGFLFGCLLFSDL